MQLTQVKKRSNRLASRSRLMGFRKRTLFFFSCVLAAILIGVVLLMLTWHRPKPDPNTPVLAAQYFVKTKMGPGVILNFSPPEWNKLETVDEDTVKITAFFEAVPKDGTGASSFDYECIVRTSRDGSWNLVKLNLTKQ